jgi:hypothetical protein
MSVMPYGEGLTPPKKSTQRAVRNAEQQAIVRKAQLQAQAVVTKAGIDLEEAAAAYRVEQRLSHGAQLTEQAVEHNTSIDHHVTRVSQGNPGLEMQNRAIHEAYVAGAVRLVHGYMTR